MDTKLTLTIESDLAQTVKNYAKEKGYTLSGLVENYFFALVKSEKTSDILLSSPLANSLLGSLKAPEKSDYKKELEIVLTEKYL